LIKRSGGEDFLEVEGQMLKEMQRRNAHDQWGQLENGQTFPGQVAECLDGKLKL
jgi:hypothetical protein